MMSTQDRLKVFSKTGKKSVSSCSSNDNARKTNFQQMEKKRQEQQSHSNPNDRRRDQYPKETHDRGIIITG